MLRNAEFLILAYGISITVISVYFLRMVVKLRSTRRKTIELTNRTTNE